jgi:hypothetical protein
MADRGQQQQQPHGSSLAASGPVAAAPHLEWLPPGGTAAAVGQQLRPEQGRGGGRIDAELWYAAGGPNQYQRGPGDCSPQRLDSEEEEEEAFAEGRGSGRAVWRR